MASSVLAAETVVALPTIAARAPARMIAIGATRAEVLEKMLRPSTEVSSDAWIYQCDHAFSSEKGTLAQDTVVVQFTNDRVSRICLVKKSRLAAIVAEIKRRPVATVTQAASPGGSDFVR